MCTKPVTWSVSRSLSVGVFISLDYWWTTKVTLHGIDEVSSQSLSSNQHCSVEMKGGETYPVYHLLTS